MVVTRPAGQADQFVTQLQRLGYEAESFPLLEIHPLTDPAPLRAALDRLDAYALVAFVSPNAIDATFAHVVRWPAILPVAVMGEGSRQALARHGIATPHYVIISPTDPQRSDSQTLLRELDLPALRAQKVLILRGESGREWLADALRAAQVEVEQVAAYRRSEPVMTAARSDHLRNLLHVDPCWIVTSSEALQNLIRAVKVVDPQFAVAKMQRQKIFVAHPRIAETAAALGFHEVFVTAAGDAGMLTALQSRA